MRILFATVGTGANRKDIASAIAFSIRSMKPEKVLLFTSEKTQQETFPHIEEFLDAELWERCQSVEFPDVNNVQTLFIAYLERMKKELQDYETDGEKPILWVDFTSGTKAMTAAIFAAGIALEAKEVCYVTGPRDEQGRVIRSEIVERIDPQLVLAERIVAEARELFNRQDYAAAAHSVEGVKNLFNKGTHLGNMAHILFWLGKAYAAWNRFEWAEAEKLLKKLFQKMEAVFQREPNLLDTELLERQREFCYRLHEGKFDNARLVDLYENARRCFREERYDDAVCRLYRAFEYSVQIRLHLEFKIDTANFYWEKFKKRLCTKTQEKYQSMRVPAKISLQSGIELLAELGDSLGLSLIEDYFQQWEPGMEYRHENRGPLQRNLDSRNTSFLAHGMTPIDRKTAKNLLDKFEKYLRSILGDEFDELRKWAAFVQI